MEFCREKDQVCGRIYRSQSELSESVLIQRYSMLVYLIEVVVMCVVGIDDEAEHNTLRVNHG